MQLQLGSPVHVSAGNIRWDMSSELDRGFDYVALLRDRASFSVAGERRWSRFC
jgi:hypothetical protein